MILPYKINIQRYAALWSIIDHCRSTEDKFSEVTVAEAAFFPDGSVVLFLRSTRAMSTGREWDPMYMSRSADDGQTWSDPVPFAHTGIYPRLCTLGCGAVLLGYARPGIFVQGCDDGHGLVWSDPVTVMTPDDRNGLANISINKPLFHEWDGGCNNPTMLLLDDHSALLFYSDFYYPDEQGIKRKTILCRKLTVEYYAQLYPVAHLPCPRHGKKPVLKMGRKELWLARRADERQYSDLPARRACVCRQRCASFGRRPVFPAAVCVACACPAAAPSI